MAFWFYRGLRRGIATTSYPKTVDPWARALPSPPAFHSARLTAELVVDVGRCTGCGRCVALGHGAAQPSGEFQLAAPDRAVLIKRVPIRDREEVGSGEK